jgi:hypothetical protein
MGKEDRGKGLAPWVPFLTVAAAYVATFLLIRRVWPFSLDNPIFVVIAMICVLGLTAMARPVVRLRVPAGWRAVRPWETRGPLATIVRWFGRLLRRTPLRLLNTHVYRKPGEVDAERLLVELESAEASHLLSACLVVPYMARAAACGWWGRLCWVAIAQLCVNVLPILHLRLARDAVARRHRVGRRLGGSP